MNIDSVFFYSRANFRRGVKRLTQPKYFIDPDIEHVLVFPSGTKFFDYEIYTNRHILLMDKVEDQFVYIYLTSFFVYRLVVYRVWPYLHHREVQCLMPVQHRGIKQFV